MHKSWLQQLDYISITCQSLMLGSFTIYVANGYKTIWDTQYYYKHSVLYTKYLLKKAKTVLSWHHLLFEFVLTLLILWNRLPITESSGTCNCKDRHKIRLILRRCKRLGNRLKSYIIYGFKGEDIWKWSRFLYILDIESILIVKGCGE